MLHQRLPVNKTVKLLVKNERKRLSYRVWRLLDYKGGAYCIWQLKNAVYGSMFFECKKAENIQGMNKNLHIFGL
jgi:hypothetical protein